MAILGSGGRRAAVTCVAMCSVWLLPGAARAYTAEQQQACSGDAMRLCGAEIPDVDRITACMIRNKAQLSPPCRAQFAPDPDPPAVPGKPVDIKPARRPVVGKPHKKPAKPNPT